ncbi:hypothetical protein DFJ58DRAFT_727158 [Suillus subalutaceus]|uniref:uncharacterized protein n=1 Tax=Suillus subalutaceus TaxID=48586 RepID=UPI001B861148|nr:uncharacterized protein DFJ58DRAFT_727158 [Suillus subalutaceus]KAG1856326.1 hypothetical protein DFJ58DRAFT_727158 [Suillus subalutaceus]
MAGTSFSAFVHRNFNESSSIVPKVRAKIKLALKVRTWSDLMRTPFYGTERAKGFTIFSANVDIPPSRAQHLI